MAAENCTSCRKYASTISLNIWDRRDFLRICAIFCRYWTCSFSCRNNQTIGAEVVCIFTFFHRFDYYLLSSVFVFDYWKARCKDSVFFISCQWFSRKYKLNRSKIVQIRFKIVKSINILRIWSPCLSNIHIFASHYKKNRAVRLRVRLTQDLLNYDRFKAREDSLA